MNTLSIKNLGDYEDLYMQSDTSLLTDVFENLLTMCLKFPERDACHFYIGPKLKWIKTLNKTKTKLNLLKNINLLLIVRKGDISCIKTKITCVERHSEKVTVNGLAWDERTKFTEAGVEYSEKL